MPRQKNFLLLTAFLALFVLTPCLAAENALPLGRANDQAKLKLTAISGAPGPNWGDFFNPDGTLRDQIDRFRAARPNGVPDVIDLGGRGAAFIPAQKSHGNSYVYMKSSGKGQLMLYLGLERLAPEPNSAVEFELNQGPAGERSLDDLMVRIHYGDGGALSGAEVLKWDVDHASGNTQWTTAGTLSGAVCSDDGLLCALGNSESLQRESWNSYDAAGNVVQTLAPNTFTLVGIDAGGILGRDALLLGAQVRTAQDVAAAQISANGSGTRIGVAAAEETAKALGAKTARESEKRMLFTDPAKESIHVDISLDACRLIAGTTLPNDAGKFICPDGQYVSGNLGKAWNELDLVPHRLTTKAGNQGNTTTDYQVTVAADSITSGRLGYDVISVPAVNTAKSDASCTVSAGSQSALGSAGTPFGGGTDVVIYRDLTIHQAKGTTCVFDYHQRLALGAHLWPGASLQSYTFPGANLSGSKKTLSIPISDITPQSINKDMTATRGSDHIWAITKGATPAAMALTCQKQQDTVELTVTWEKLPATPYGDITVLTHVYATNPAARKITINVTDVIYSGKTPLDTVSSGNGDVPANTRQLILTHTFTVPPNTTDLNDIATATYTDLATGIPVPGNTTSAASAIVELSGPELNGTATINDIESIAGKNLSYSADAFTPAIGSFDNGYVAGARTAGSVSWTTNPAQSGSGSVTFNKTIYADPANNNDRNGTLSDIATLTGSNGFTAAPASASIDIGVTLRGAITIIINTGSILQSVDYPATFNFSVTGPNGFSASPSITLDSGSTGSVAVANLPPGCYTVSNDIGIQPPICTSPATQCSGEVTFTSSQLFKGDLMLAKSLTGGPADYTGPFAIHYDCGTFGSGDKTVDAGSFEMVKNIPLGTVCTVSEPTLPTPPTGYSFGAATFSPSATITIENKNETVTVTTNNTISRDAGSLKITKSVTGDVPPGFSQTFDFAVACTLSGSPNLNYNLSINYPMETLVTQGNIPTGYSCAVTEGPRTDVPGYTWESVAYTGNPAAVAAKATEYTVGAENPISRDKGLLKITKSVTGDVPPGFSQTFNFIATCTGDPNSPYNLSINYPSDAAAIQGNIPTGSVCTVTEGKRTDVPGYTWGDPVFTGNPATISTKGETYTVEVEDPITRDKGSLKITKSVTGDLPPSFSQTFTLTATCAGDPNSPYSLSINYPNATEVTQGNIPTGSVCTVTEGTRTDVLGYTWGEPVFTGNPATITTKGTEYTVNVQNPISRDTGSLKITKTVSNPDSATLPANFSVNFDCGAGYTGNVSVAPGSPATVNGIPMGNNCTVTEVAPAPIAGYIWGAVTYTPASVQISASGGTFDISVGNSIARDVAVAARTIGYWKNWSSCGASNGKQDPVLDRTLAKTEPAGEIVSALSSMLYLVIHGSTATPDASPDCPTAVRILDKSAVDTGKKMASDPAFNLAAQLLAAELNFTAGAPRTGAAISAVNQAVPLLGKYKFDGIKHNTISATDAQIMNNLATILDNYNNSRQ